MVRDTVDEDEEEVGVEVVVYTFIQESRFFFFSRNTPRTTCSAGATMRRLKFIF